jgi:ElaB/YqjD/DUF883 family membrane-anchored ribosome-binding protein
MRTKTGNGHNMQLEQFIEDLKTVVQDGQKLIRAGASGVRETAVSGVKSTDRLVREHPYQSLGVIFGVGVLIGLLAYGFFTRESEMDEF